MSYRPVFICNTIKRRIVRTIKFALHKLLATIDAGIQNIHLNVHIHNAYTWIFFNLYIHTDMLSRHSSVFFISLSLSPSLNIFSSLISLAYNKYIDNDSVYKVCLYFLYKQKQKIILIFPVGTPPSKCYVDLHRFYQLKESHIHLYTGTYAHEHLIQHLIIK